MVWWGGKQTLWVILVNGKRCPQFIVKWNEMIGGRHMILYLNKTYICIHTKNKWDIKIWIEKYWWVGIYELYSVLYPQLLFQWVCITGILFKKRFFWFVHKTHKKFMFRYNKLFWNCRKPSKQVIINKSLRVNGFWSQMVSVKIVSLPS